MGVCKLECEHLAAQMSSLAHYLYPTPVPQSPPKGCSWAETGSKRAEMWGRLSPVPFLSSTSWQWGSSQAQASATVCSTDKQGSHSTGAGTQLERFYSDLLPLPRWTLRWLWERAEPLLGPGFIQSVAQIVNFSPC